MLKIQSYQTTFITGNTITCCPTNQTSTAFKSSKKTPVHSTALAATGVIGAGAVGTTLFLAGKGKMNKMSYEEALRKSGIELKDGIAFIKETGEKFTGTIKRNITTNRKETINFENGTITEKLYHNLFGRELEGEFYKEGELYMKVGKHVGLFRKSFPYYKYEEGKRTSAGDVISSTSVFKWAREALKGKEKF